MPWTARTAIIASFMLLGCEPPAPPPAEATLIRALAVQVSQFDRTSALTGEILARHESNLGFRVGGKVIERLVDVGNMVAEGGETVLIGGSQKLRPGQKVTIRQGSGA
jgi:multidrug efflux pump subunit AcrA (membrane-fusion protein)